RKRQERCSKRPIQNAFVLAGKIVGYEDIVSQISAYRACMALDGQPAYSAQCPPVTWTSNELIMPTALHSDPGDRANSPYALVPAETAIPVSPPLGSPLAMPSALAELERAAARSLQFLNAKKFRGHSGNGWVESLCTNQLGAPLQESRHLLTTRHLTRG